MYDKRIKILTVSNWDWDQLVQHYSKSEVDAKFYEIFSEYLPLIRHGNKKRKEKKRKTENMLLGNCFDWCFIHVNKQDKQKRHCFRKLGLTGPTGPTCPIGRTV